MSVNELGRETSPYLLQHKDNPVHWLPWGERALARAQAEDKPILLSVGYAACHWCHVMAHESFEDPDTAALMNADYVNVKVDREERPDVDKLYMDALHALGEQGGWPLTMFLSPDGAPFWGGTYFPPESRYGRPGFRHVLREITRIWRTERDKVTANSSALARALRPDPAAGAGATLAPEQLRQAAGAIAGGVDRVHGGLKGAPKFPQTSIFEFLRRMALRQSDPGLLRLVSVTLDNICQGGIYDHLGGGFSRYSVDARWLVPHFEKMLYDNAQLVQLLARMWLATGSDLYRRRVEETIAWALSDMRAPEGGFAASYDADSEGEEGRYYVWTEREVDSLLEEPDRSLFKRVYDVTPEGNWEGHTILNRLKHMETLPTAEEARLAAARDILRARRTNRVPPGFDDKVLADWNGLMIAALAEAGLIFGREDWILEARRALADVLGRLWVGDRLHHSYRAGALRNAATADGYANLIAAALAVFEASSDVSALDRALELTAALERDHWDPVDGGFYFSSPRAGLIVRQRYAHDDATPNANATMLANYARLAVLTGDEAHLRKGRAIHDAFARAAAGNPFAFASFLSAFDDHIGLVQAVLVEGRQPEAARRLEEAFLRAPLPGRVLTRIRDGASLPQTHPAAAKTAPAGRAALYLCVGSVCSTPVHDPSDIAGALEAVGMSAGV